MEPKKYQEDNDIKSYRTYSIHILYLGTDDVRDVVSNVDWLVGLEHLQRHLQVSLNGRRGEKMRGEKDGCVK